MGRACPRPGRVVSDEEVLRTIPDVDPCWDRRDRWHTYREGAWRWPEEHINVKEARASIMALERHVRSPQNHHCRLLQLSDNLVSVLAFDKGRSKSWSLNSLCRRVCSVVVAANVLWCFRHIRSARNVSDEGSRKKEWMSPLAGIGRRLARVVEPPRLECTTSPPRRGPRLRHLRPQAV